MSELEPQNKMILFEQKQVRAQWDEEALNMLAEVATTDMSAAKKPRGIKESAVIAVEGANVAKNARKQIEREKFEARGY
ncbi:MAG: hypothetical protein FWE57_11930 [Chitinispirillia bacterium]|nr:hypothetical protein [Chitinispirillia bacterium]